MEFLVYVNADCMLDGDLLKTLQALYRHGYANKRFVASAQRCNIPVTTLMDFSGSDCAENLRKLRKQGVLDAKNAMDIFICHPDVLSAFPRFLVGRPGWDQWLVWYARTSGADVIDVSAGFLVFHQSHDYTHVTGGWREACLGEEAVYNRQLTAGNQMDLVAAQTHRLMDDGTLSTQINTDNTQHIGVRALYYSEQAVQCMELGDYLGALDYLDMLLVVGRDNVPFAQQFRAICFYKMGRFTEAKSAIINELTMGLASTESMNILVQIAREISMKTDC
jgi:tetratricopeptide (TPR) repeat protein